jgi:hypothetical protein
MGGPHDCEQLSEDVQRLEVTLPDPPPHNPCGNARRGRLNQFITIDGSHLTHLTRFFERVQDDEEVSEIHVSVREGTLQFFGTVGMYSAKVGYSEDE